MSGVVNDLPEQEYHGRKDSLSVSGAKLLLPPNCPALFKWRRDNPQPHKAVFDFGHAAHKAVLGVGQPVRYVDADSWATKAAKEAKAAAYEAGEIPLLAKDEGVIEGMVVALQAHPVAAQLFKPGTGTPEASLFWTDEDSGVNLRGRLDWLPTDRRHTQRLVIPDYKTAASADPQSFAKSAASYGYAMQAAFYMDGAKALGLDDDPGFTFVVQEKTEPYLVNVIAIDPDDIRIARGLNQRAIRIYKDCTESGHWPGYAGGVVGMPNWWRFEYDDEMEMV